MATCIFPPMSADNLFKGESGRPMLSSEPVRPVMMPHMHAAMMIVMYLTS